MRNFKRTSRTNHQMFSFSFLNRRYWCNYHRPHTGGHQSDCRASWCISLLAASMYTILSSSFFIPFFFFLRIWKRGNFIELICDLPLSNYFKSSYLRSSRSICVFFPLPLHFICLSSLFLFSLYFVFSCPCMRLLRLHL